MSFTIFECSFLDVEYEFHTKQNNENENYTRGKEFHVLFVLIKVTREVYGC